MASRTPNPGALLAQGLEHHRNGRLPQAVSAYQAALKLAPDLGDALKMQGLALFQMGMRDPGLSMMKRAAETLRTDAAAWFNLAQALRASGRTEDMLAAFEHAVELAPDAADERMMLSSEYARLGRRKEAIAHARLAATAAPEDANAWDALSAMLYQENEIEESVAAHAKAVVLQPRIAQERRLRLAEPDPSLKPKIAELPLSAARHPELATREALDAFAEERGLMLIDDALPDPIAYRTWALEQDFQPIQYRGQNFPGIQTEGFETPELLRLMATALGRRIKSASPDTGALRISYADSTARTDIHVDNEEGESRDRFAAVLYLNLPGQEQGGTQFWRHKASGWDRRYSDAEARAAGYASFKAFQERWLPNLAAERFNELAARRDAWEALVELPMKHNRLVLYRSDYFHSISEVFGSTPADGRLVQLFFFELC